MRLTTVLLFAAVTPIAGFFPPFPKFESSPTQFIPHVSSASLNSPTFTLPSDVHVFEPTNVDKRSIPCILFFTGGNSIISQEIYSSFLSILSGKNLAVYTIPFKFQEFDQLVEKLHMEYSDVLVMSHSSGSIPLMANSAENPHIKRAILLDPIDARVDRRKKIRVNNLREVLFIRAEKAYEGETLPFIPGFLELTPDKWKTSPDCKIQVVDSEKHGHCDLLNPMYSNIVHRFLRPICDGSEDRSQRELYSYMDWIATTVRDFIGTPAKTEIWKSSDASEDKPCSENHDCDKSCDCYEG